MQFAFDLYHQAIIYVGPTLCVCVHQCVLQYDADCHAMSQDIIMTVWHCEEWSPALHPPPPPRQNSFISSCRLVWKSLAWESAQIPSGSQQRGTLMWHLTAYLCSFFFFFISRFCFFSLFFFVLQPSVRMQSSWPFQAEEDNLVEEREGAVCGMFIESSARWRWGKEGRRGRRAESGKMWGVVQGSDIWSKGKTEGKRPRWGWWHLLHSNPDYVISFWRVLLLLTVSPPLTPTHQTHSSCPHAVTQLPIYSY